MQLRAYYRTLIGSPMLEVERNGQRGFAAVASGRNGNDRNCRRRRFMQKHSLGGCTIERAVRAGCEDAAFARYGAVELPSTQARAHRPFQ